MRTLLREVVARVDSCCTKASLIVPFLPLPPTQAIPSHPPFPRFPYTSLPFSPLFPFLSVLSTLTLPFSFLYIPPQRLPAHFSSPPLPFYFPLFPHVPSSRPVLLPHCTKSRPFSFLTLYPSRLPLTLAASVSSRLSVDASDRLQRFLLLTW